VLPPCNPLIEDYTEIFYMIDEGDIPSIHCKMVLRGPKSMRKVYGLSLIFIDFHVQRSLHFSVALIPSLTHSWS
jgi:hypothetical protein